MPSSSDKKKEMRKVILGYWDSENTELCVRKDFKHPHLQVIFSEEACIRTGEHGRTTAVLQRTNNRDVDAIPCSFRCNSSLFVRRF